MGHAYASQNELGRLCDECVYESDMKMRLLEEGFQSVDTQVPVTVSHGTFSKTYYLDFVVEGALYELETASSIVGEHTAQLLNYILLLGLGHGKLLNFRPPKVQGQLMTSELDGDARRNVHFVTTDWQEQTPACAILGDIMRNLMRDWGAFLDIALYREAMVHFLGGPAKVEQRAVLKRGGRTLGSQSILVHSPETAFRLTAFTSEQDTTVSHLRRLLALTDLRAIQWINLNHERIEFRTLTR